MFLTETLLNLFLSNFSVRNLRFFLAQVIEKRISTNIHWIYVLFITKYNIFAFSYITQKLVVVENQTLFCNFDCLCFRFFSFHYFLLHAQYNQLQEELNLWSHLYILILEKEISSNPNNHFFFSQLSKLLTQKLTIILSFFSKKVQ